MSEEIFGHSSVDHNMGDYTSTRTNIRVINKGTDILINWNKETGICIHVVFSFVQTNEVLDFLSCTFKDIPGSSGATKQPRNSVINTLMPRTFLTPLCTF